jgi:hypothetical protein
MHEYGQFDTGDIQVSWCGKRVNACMECTYHAAGNKAEVELTLLCGNGLGAEWQLDSKGELKVVLQNEYGNALRVLELKEGVVENIRQRINVGERILEITITIEGDIEGFLYQKLEPEVKNEA